MQNTSEFGTYSWCPWAVAVCRKMLSLPAGAAVGMRMRCCVWQLTQVAVDSKSLKAAHGGLPTVQPRQRFWRGRAAALVRNTGSDRTLWQGGAQSSRVLPTFCRSTGKLQRQLCKDKFAVFKCIPTFGVTSSDQQKRTSNQHTQGVQVVTVASYTPALTSSYLMSCCWHSRLSSVQSVPDMTNTPGTGPQVGRELGADQAASFEVGTVVHLQSWEKTAPPEACHGCSFCLQLCPTSDAKGDLLHTWETWCSSWDRPWRLTAVPRWHQRVTGWTSPCWGQRTGRAQQLVFGDSQRGARVSQENNLRLLSGRSPRLTGETSHVGGLRPDEPLCRGLHLGEVLSASEYPRSLRRQPLRLRTRHCNAVNGMLIVHSVWEHLHATVDPGGLICCGTFITMRKPFIWARNWFLCKSVALQHALHTGAQFVSSY